MDYTTLSVIELRTELGNVVRETQATFGGLDVRQVNWRPEAGGWSVAQCFDHLLTSNRLMIEAAEDVLNDARPRTIWQRLPLLPGVFGRMLIRSQAPSSSRKFTAPSKAQPGSAHIGADVIQRFIGQQRDAAVKVQALDEGVAARSIMTSPFRRVVTYSVLDGWRLIVAHDWRHIEQARRVMQAVGMVNNHTID